MIIFCPNLTLIYGETPITTLTILLIWMASAASNTLESACLQPKINNLGSFRIQLQMNDNKIFIFIYDPIIYR